MPESFADAGLVVFLANSIILSSIVVFTVSSVVVVPLTVKSPFTVRFCRINPSPLTSKFARSGSTPNTSKFPPTLALALLST